jgi:hypothetical protein
MGVTRNAAANDDDADADADADVHHRHIPGRVVDRVLAFLSDRCIIRDVFRALDGTPLFGACRDSARVRQLVRRIEVLRRFPYAVYRNALRYRYRYDRGGALEALVRDRDVFSRAFVSAHVWCVACDRAYSARYWPRHVRTRRHGDALDDATKKLQRTLVWGEAIAV